MALRLSSTSLISQIANTPALTPRLGPSILRHCAQLWQPFAAHNELSWRPFAITLPWILSDIWESVLRAVPKKKTSYSKTRSRQMAGKALKDVTALNTCSGCGQTKRAHTICPFCLNAVAGIRAERRKLSNMVDKQEARRKKHTLSQQEELSSTTAGVGEIQDAIPSLQPDNSPTEGNTAATEQKGPTKS